MLAERRVASEALGRAGVFKRQRDSKCLCERASARREGRGKVSNHTQKNKTRRFPRLDLLCWEPDDRTKPAGERRGATHVSAEVPELALVRFLQDHGVPEDFSPACDSCLSLC